MTDSFSAAQTTTFRQVRALLHLDREDRAQSAHQLVQDTAGLFFKPTNDVTPRNPEGSFKSTQTTALLIGPKNLLPSFGRISRQLRIVTTLASTGAAAVFLLAVWRDSILIQRCIATVTARRRCCIHGVNPFSSSRHEQYTTPFGQRPLPICSCMFIENPLLGHLPEESLYQPGRPHLLVCCRSPWRTYNISCASIPAHLRASSRSPKER